MNGITKHALTNDENWKLLKFLCDGIEENKVDTKRASNQPTINIPRPIKIKGDILAKRKHRNTDKYIRNTILTLGSTATLSNRVIHSKTKSALYTSASANTFTRNSGLYSPVRAALPSNMTSHTHKKSKSITKKFSSSPLRRSHLVKEHRKSRSLTL